jgi:hypothetical protein
MTSLEHLGARVAEGIAELRDEFGAVDATPTGDGGAQVTVVQVALPPSLTQSHAWMGFVIPYNYDEVQIYGHFLPADLVYVDGRTLAGPGLQVGQIWGEHPAIKISRNSPRWHAGVDSATSKLVQVVQWLGERK